MGAGATSKQIYRFTYRALKKTQYRLAAHGIESSYAHGCLFGVNVNLKVKFNIYFRTLRASNGETACLLQVVVHHLGGFDSEEYKDWDAPKGIERIIELFGVKSTQGATQP